MGRDERPPCPPVSPEALAQALAQKEAWASEHLAGALERGEPWATRFVHDALSAEAAWAHEVLVLGLRVSSAWAVEAFYAWFLPPVERSCLNILHDPSAAKDCAHDMALLFVSEIVHRDRVLESFHGYLRTMVTRRAIRYAQKRRRFSSGPDGDGGPPVHAPQLNKHYAPPIEPTREELLQRAAEMKGLARAMELLDPSQRDLLDMRYSRGLTLEQVASLLGVSFQAIHKREKRALAILERELRKQGFEPPESP